MTTTCPAPPTTPSAHGEAQTGGPSAGPALPAEARAGAPDGRGGAAAHAANTVIHAAPHAPRAAAFLPSRDPITDVRPAFRDRL
jgi:hypothetical protein